MALDNEILDNLVHDLAQSALNLLTEHTELTDAQRVEYCGRAMAEILAIVITAAPPGKMVIVVNQICEFLRVAVTRNQNAQDVFGFSLGNSLQERFQDALFIAKKPKEIS